MPEQYDISNEPIVISKPLLDIFFNPTSKQYANLKNSSDAIALYIFYYYTAKWQKTNQPKATTGYTAKGLNWTEERVRKTKKILISLDLVKDITSRNEITKTINGHYIYVKFIWSKEKAILASEPPSGQSDSLAQTGANALSNSNRNTLSDGNKVTVNSNTTGSRSGSENIPVNQKDNQENNDLVNQENKPLVKIKNSVEKLRAERLIKHWSDLGYTTNHCKKPDTKTYQKIIKKLICLQKGTFKNIGPFDPDWIQKNKIPESWFTRAWTYQEIKDALVIASRYAHEDYWVPDKAFWKSLDNILYSTPFVNKQKKPGTCWLFAAIKNPPLPNKQTFQKLQLPETTAKLMKNPIWPKGYKFDEFRLDKGLVELETFADNLIQDSYGKSRQWFGTLHKLLKEYLAWIDGQGWIDKINENLIGTGNKVFRKFIEDQEEEIGLKIHSKGWKR